MTTNRTFTVLSARLAATKALRLTVTERQHVKSMGHTPTPHQSVTVSSYILNKNDSYFQLFVNTLLVNYMKNLAHILFGLNLHELRLQLNLIAYLVAYKQCLFYRVINMKVLVVFLQEHLELVILYR